MKMNEQTIQDQVVTVKRCMPKQRVWDFSKKEEMNKIFVSNLPVTVDKKALRELFDQVCFYKTLKH